MSVVQLASDDLKGRIIGREGRNIRALENLTGVDIIIDDTPQAVVLSAFDGVRREIARLTIETLIADGRIHPSRIEETFYQSKAQIEQQIVQAGEQACFEANVHGLHPELVKTLGRLHYRTSYGQNVLKHSIECAHLASIMAAELGASQKTARRAALLHDLGKAVTHEVEGPHAVISAQMAKRYRESPSVCHAIEAHHYDVEPQTVEAVLVIAADAVSASRPGGRGREPRALHQAARGAREDRDGKARRRALLRDAGRTRGARHGEARGRRRRRCGAPQPRDRPRDRGAARVPRPDQGHRDPGVASEWRLQSSQTSLKALQKAYRPVLDGIGVSADNERMRRFAILGVCLLAGLTLPQVALGAPALLAHTCGSNCGSLYAEKGKGTLNVNGNGAEWGAIASGTVKIQDKSHNGHRDWSIKTVGKAARTTETTRPAITVCKVQQDDDFSTGTVWWLSLNGTGVNASVVGERRLLHQGVGALHPERAEAARAWPSGGKFLKL